MVDTRDLKSLGQECLYEFESRPRHKKDGPAARLFCASNIIHRGADSPDLLGRAANCAP